MNIVRKTGGKTKFDRIMSFLDGMYADCYSPRLDDSSWVCDKMVEYFDIEADLAFDLLTHWKGTLE